MKTSAEPNRPVPRHPMKTPTHKPTTKPSQRKLPRARVMFAYPEPSGLFAVSNLKMTDDYIPVLVAPLPATKQGISEALARFLNLTHEERVEAVAKVIKRADAANYDPDLGPSFAYYEQMSRAILSLMGLAPHVGGKGGGK